MNTIWTFLVLIAFLVAAASGHVSAVTDAAFTSVKSAVETAFSFIGVMAFWLGLMQVAERAGLIDVLSRALRPVVRLLFPSVPPGAPAEGAMLLNMSANLLGLGSAATPFGLKAMEELQKLNPDPATASDAMCTFLAINTSAITLIPATVIALRAANGSSNPTGVVGTTLIATICSTLAAVTADRLLRNRGGRRHGGSR